MRRLHCGVSSAQVCILLSLMLSRHSCIHNCSENKTIKQLGAVNLSWTTAPQYPQASIDPKGGHDGTCGQRQLRGTMLEKVVMDGSEAEHCKLQNINI